MRTLLRIIAACILLGTAGWWLRAGSNKGWTKDSVNVWKYDEITEISYPEKVKKFVPGVDFLGGGVAASLIIAALSFVPPKRRSGSLPAAT